MCAKRHWILVLRSSVVLKSAMTIFLRHAPTEEAVLINRVDKEAVTPPIQPADNPCGIMKVEVIAGQRRFGGIITRMLAWSVVANICLTAEAESATHICVIASEIEKAPKLYSIIYDHACMLARSMLNQALFGTSSS